MDRLTINCDRVITKDSFWEIEMPTFATISSPPVVAGKTYTASTSQEIFTPTPVTVDQIVQGTFPTNCKAFTLWNGCNSVVTATYGTESFIVPPGASYSVVNDPNTIDTILTGNWTVVIPVVGDTSTTGIEPYIGANYRSAIEV